MMLLFLLAYGQMKFNSHYVRSLQGIALVLDLLYGILFYSLSKSKIIAIY